jgi:hypothetical protein
MLLKAVGQPLDTAKNYRKSSGKSPKAIRKPLGILKGILKLLGNAQIPPSGNWRGGRIAQQIARLKHGNFRPFS